MRQVLPDIWYINPSWQLVHLRIMSKAERLCEKKEGLAKKESLEGNCEILRTIFEPRELSSHVPASQKGVNLFYNPSK